MNFPGRLSAYHFWEDGPDQQYVNDQGLEDGQQPQAQPTQLTPNTAWPANMQYPIPVNGLAFPSVDTSNRGDPPSSPGLHQRMRTLSVEEAAVDDGAVMRSPNPARSSAANASSYAQSSGSLGPSKQYLDFCSAPSTTLPTPKGLHLLVLDLNGTLLVRLPKNSGKQRAVRQRPYLRPFLEYLFHADPQRLNPWRVMVWSSAQPHNVDDMVSKAFGPYRDQLLAVWARDTLGLTPHQYNQKTQTTKDLEKIWAQVPAPSSKQFSATNTILLDDSALKAHRQPHNHLPLLEYTTELHRRDRNRRSPTGTASSTGPPPDQHLLAVVGVLNTIAHESSACGWIRAGGLWTGRELAKQEETRRLKTLAIKEKMQRVLQATASKQPASESSTSTSQDPVNISSSSTMPSSNTAGPPPSDATDATGNSKKREEELREKLRQSMLAKRHKAVAPSPAPQSDPDSEAEMDEVEGLLSEGLTESTGTGDPIPGEGDNMDIWYEDPVNLAYWVQTGVDVLNARGIVIDPGDYDNDNDNEPHSGVGSSSGVGSPSGSASGGGKKKGKARASAAQAESNAFLEDLLKILPPKPSLDTINGSGVPLIPPLAMKTDVKLEYPDPRIPSSPSTVKNEPVSPMRPEGAKNGPRRKGKGRGREYLDRDRPRPGSERNRDAGRSGPAVSPTNARFPSLLDSYVPDADRPPPRDREREWERERDRDYDRNRDRDYGLPLRYNDRPSRYDRDRDYWHDRRPDDYYVDYDRGAPYDDDDDRLPYGGPSSGRHTPPPPPRAPPRDTYDYGRDLYGYALPPSVSPSGLGQDLGYGPADLGYGRQLPPRYDPEIPDEWLRPSGDPGRRATY